MNDVHILRGTTDMKITLYNNNTQDTNKIIGDQRRETINSLGVRSCSWQPEKMVGYIAGKSMNMHSAF